MQHKVKAARIDNFLKLILSLLVVILVVYYGYLLVTSLPLNFSRADVMALIRQHRLSGAGLLIVMLCIASCIPGVPVALLGVLAGVCLGKVSGALVNLTGMVAGNCLALYIMAHYGEHHRGHPKGRYQQKLAAWLKQWRYPELGLVLGYMVPLVPTSLVDWVLQESSLSQRSRLRVMIFGLLPTAIFYAVGGDAVLRGDGVTLGLTIGVFLVMLALAYLGVRLLSTYRQKVRFDHNEEHNSRLK
ncbi:VTT domain-containing protein [Weissella halotolerans]|uniref:TVP38/TMEM64 family membrane protein n=1 Tax=Weissella halotolerans DSM 20190 TaxID=1123500 RepID=A0A0R2G4J4_9LACO|nr:VTT domain-containing protein [Weissella halotolerans]KRN31773.1 hypothetical protein IV68_GL001030 [Weissella halotolerans DSM 20190]